MKKMLIAVLLFFIQITACNIGDLASSINQTRDAIIPRLDNATSAIEAAPQQWESVMKGLSEDLKTDFSDIAYRLDGSIGRLNVMWTSSALCILESVPKQAILTIKNLRAELLGLPLTKAEVVICGSSLSEINLNISLSSRTNILCSGYNIDKTALETFLLKQSNGASLKVDILNFPGDNQIALNTAKIPDATLAAYDVLILRDKNSGKTYDYPIIPKRPAPITSTIASLGSTGALLFPHTGGDKEFGGHGPLIRVFFRLKISADRRQLLYDLYFDAIETKSDYTRVSGYVLNQVAYTLTDNTKKILNIVGNEYASYTKVLELTDLSTSDNLGVQSAIGTFDIVGDTNGWDVGRTGIKAIKFTKLYTLEIQ